MEILASKDKLIKQLEQFRQFCNCLNFEEINKIVFFNPESFIMYVNNCKAFKDKKVEDFWLKIEGYIPYILSEKNLEKIVELSLNKNKKDLFKLEKDIKYRLQMDFIVMIKNIQNELEWLNFLEICEEIRQEREDEYSII